MNKLNHFYATKHPKRRGYTVRHSGPQLPGWMPKGYAGWYRFKRDATAKAIVYNNSKKEQ